MKKLAYIAALGAMLGLGSCDDLDQYPTVEVSSDKVYASSESSAGVLAQCYMSFVTTGNGAKDLSIGGEALLRSLFNLQEGTTDAIAYTWLSGDKLDYLTYNNWDANDQWVKYVWYRCYVTITSCNDFIKNAAGSSDAEMQNMVYEARFLRALSLSYILDLFGKGVIPTEDQAIGDANLPEKSGKEIYDYITSELEEIAPLMSSTVAYPRATKGAAYALLSRIYLNSKVYAGVEDYDKCITAAENCEKEGYVLESKDDYWKLFGADNHKHAGAGKEIIFAFYVDADYCMTWGATTGIICGFAPNTSVFNDLLGIASGWSSLRANKAFSDLFSETDDIRSTFWVNYAVTYKKDDDGNYELDEDGNKIIDKEYSWSQLVSIEDEPTQGWISTKFNNKLDDGTGDVRSANPTCSTDEPILRLAEVKLNKAEALYRQGKTGDAKAIFDEIRDRVGATTNYTLDDDFILAERGRELAYELVRRTDLIRFNKYGGDVNYNWEFKGGAASGKNFEAWRNVFPIPSDELAANSNLSQNAGY